ncbi:MAG: NUDIX domain-containing protein [Acetobacteraceae bacterium]|nr:NUDIX domain-containing protein [Acetobacteraceae bacterium]
MPTPPRYRPEEFTAAGEPRPDRPARPQDAASLLLWRPTRRGAEVLMGVRSAKHRFMPSVLVFPGGGVDPADRSAPAARPLPEATRAALEHRASPRLAHGLAMAALRELKEETGLHLSAETPSGPLPDPGHLSYLCRALTPALSPVRFNARFLVAPGEEAAGTLGGSGELEHLGWYRLDGPLPHAPALITARVLEEFRAWLAMSEEQRRTRPLVWFQGRDNRRLERPRRR